MGTYVCLMKHLHLTLVVAVLIAGCHAVGHSLVHLVSGIDDHLHIFLLQVFLCKLSNLLARNQLSTCKNRLCELCYSIQQKLAWVNDAHA